MPDKKSELLKAATSIFAQKGYRGATTRAIARRAQADEGSIYRLFGSKQRLYWAVLEQKLGAAGSLPSPQQQGSPEKVLADWIQGRKSDWAAMRLLHFLLLEAVPAGRELRKPSLMQLYLPLAEYVDTLKERGVIRREVPTQAAALALASLRAYHMFFELAGGAGCLQMDEAALPQLYTQIWLHGVGEPPRAVEDPASREIAYGHADAVNADAPPSGFVQE
jgi:AcrR family transcriptional regulator